MSRYDVTLLAPVQAVSDGHGDLNKGVASIATYATYGFDHVCGLFLQLYNAKNELISNPDGLYPSRRGAGYTPRL